MEPSPQASEIAAVALAKAADFVEALRPLAAAGYLAVDEAIGQLCDPSDDDGLRDLRSAAISGLVAILMGIGTESTE